MAEERSPRKGPTRRSISREERRHRATRRRSRRQLIFALAAGIVGLFVIAGLFVPQLAQFREPSVDDQQVDRNVGTQVPVQPGQVIAVDAPHEPYSTSPPTSGPRYAEEAPWGIHEEQQPDERVVRNLEAGGIALNYNLSDGGAVDQLHGFVESQQGFPGCVVLQPYDGVAAGQVVLTAWGWRQELTGVDTQALQAFVNAHRNQGPLFLNDNCGYVEPTPAPAPTAEGTP